MNKLLNRKTALKMADWYSEVNCLSRLKPHHDVLSRQFSIQKQILHQRNSNVLCINTKNGNKPCTKGGIRAKFVRFPRCGFAWCWRGKAEKKSGDNLMEMFHKKRPKCHKYHYVAQGIGRAVRESGIIFSNQSRMEWFKNSAINLFIAVWSSMGEIRSGQYHDG